MHREPLACLHPVERGQWLTIAYRTVCLILILSESLPFRDRTDLVFHTSYDALSFPYVPYLLQLETIVHLAGRSTFAC